MGLYERWSSDAPPGKIHVHAFAAAIREWTRGAVTAGQIISTFALDSEDQTELTAIQSHYNSLTAEQKVSYAVKIHDVMLLSEEGIYTKAKAKAELGF